MIGKILWGLSAVTATLLCYDTLRDKTPARLSAERVHTADVTESVREEVARPKTPPQREIDTGAPLGNEPPEFPELEADHPRGRQSNLQVVMEQQFDSDPEPNRASRERETTVGELFSAANLEELGSLEEISCKMNICRGVLEIANPEADHALFSKTVLSEEFGKAVPSAFSVASRETQDDGTIIATFYLHPQDSFEGIPEEVEEM